jgi:Putative transmembrane protein (PGPGW)
VNGTITLTYKWARRIAISLIGGTVLIAGLAMTVLPGPAIVVIPLGLGILGLEFAWARRWLRRVKERAQQFMPRLAGLQATQRGADERQGSGMSQPPAAPPAPSAPGGTPDRIR